MIDFSETLAHTAADLASRIAALPEGPGRRVVAIAGPPGAGKSTLAEAVVADLVARGEAAKLVPMDGYHLDNRILEARGMRPRKGAPETFDFGGFASAVRRAKTEPTVYLPDFDRSRDFAFAAAVAIEPETRILVVEGNYLVLDEDPWRTLAQIWDFSVFLDVPMAELERRLIARWLDHGFDRAGAEAKALGNDIPNARRVNAAQVPVDLVLSP